MTKAAHKDPIAAQTHGAALALALGETWFIRFRGQERLHKVQIAAMTERAVAFRHSKDGGPLTDGAWLGWFERSRIRWSERLK